MRRVLLFLALIISVQINGWSQNITGYEYWIDDDANISKQSVTGAPQYNFDQLIDLSALKDGLHVFNIRFEDNKGQWSSLLSRFFYKNPVATSENSNIVSYEYWLDSDYANKVSQTVTAVPQIVVGEQLDYASLKEGLHLFNIRFKDSQGVWSSLLTRFFYKSALDNSGSVQIVEYEYWFDDDYVQVVNKSITSTSQLSVNESFDFSDLSSGLHSFNIRVKDNLGKWSSPLTQFIYKKPVEFSGSKEITNYQYWLNDNFENAKTIAVANSSSVELIENLDFSALLAGTHQLKIRFKDNNGSWSGVLTEEFLKVAQTYEDHLMAYYPFDAHANDESGQEHHGTAMGVTATTDRKGKANCAYAFDGVDDYIDLGAWTNGGPMTITFWARWDAFPNYSRIVDLGNGSSSDNIIVSNYQTGPRLFWQVYSISTKSAIAPANSLQQDQWDFYAVTVDESGVTKQYKNGRLINELTTGVVPRQLLRTKQYVGKSNFSQDGYFKGAIDELRIFNTALSEADITSQFNFVPTDVEIISLSNLKVYPNPVKDVLKIDLPQENCSLALYNMNGRLVYSKKAIGIMEEIQMGDLEAGVYILQIKCESQYQTLKIVKQ